MSITNYLSSFANRRSLVPLAFAVLAGLCCSASAQSLAPQLLPYTVKLVAGGGTVAIASGATCPVSGLKSTDAYGDGCLATEIELGNTAIGGATPGARSAVADAGGNVFFTDYSNALVRRIDAVTGIVTAVAGGATSSPASGATCGTNTSSDAIGDGCLGTLVKLSHPVAIAFAPNGDLYFSDTGQGQVRKIASTAGVVPATGGVISLIAGNVAGTYGYAASNGTTTIVAATQSYLRSPYGLAFDALGDLFIVDEYTEAILVVNTNATGTNTVNGVPVAAGTIWKIAGTATGSSAPYCVNGTSGSYGCSYGLYSQNIQANTDEFDSTYSVAVDPNGVVYAGDEYYDSVFKVTAAGVMSTFAGIQNTVGVKPTLAKRGAAGSFGIGSMFGVAADANSNIYITDASSGAIWRVDGAGQSMYVVAGGATSVCSAATDTYGDGCPALQAKFGSSGAGNYATATLPGPGIYAISVDANSTLYVGDTELNLVREIVTGTQFGNIGASQTDVLEVHFAANDSAATGGFTLTSGASIFSLGTPTCTTNSDSTTDCLLPVTASPSTPGAFTGTLQVQSQLNGKSTFQLSGTFVQSPVTRTLVAAASPTCSGSTVYATTASSILTASIVANGPSAPTGNIIFYANGTALAPTTGVAVGNIGTSSAPVYGATLTTTFATPGTYAITATYSGNSYFKTSTGAATTSITSTLPTFTTAVVSYQQSAVAPGQTALYSFNINQVVYSGTIAFACSGLPAYSSCSFSTISITANGCSTTSTVALNIVTQQSASALQSSIGLGGYGPWGIFSTLLGVGMALLIGLRRRRAALRFGPLWMALALLVAALGTVACQSTIQSTPSTPAGTYSVTVTATGSAGTTTSFSVPLTVK
ncbi:MAG: hypothetical protein ABSF57_07080 [Acidobacteriaceae bacterium]